MGLSGFDSPIAFYAQPHAEDTLYDTVSESSKNSSVVPSVPEGSA